MENKIDQIIYKYEQGDDAKENTWSFNELRDSLVCNESINEWYINHWDNFVYNSENLKNKKKWAEDEIWRKVKYYGGTTKYGQYDIWTSNYGRIARRIGENKYGENEYEILTDYYEEKIEKSLNKNLLKNHETKNKVGYLKIDGLRPYVYQMVADAWLEDYIYDETEGHIHHITNDGYDNRPENLILVSATEHKKIHSGNYGKEDNEYKPGKYDKK